jgi:hypothetical protein
MWYNFILKIVLGIPLVIITVTLLPFIMILTLAGYIVSGVIDLFWTYLSTTRVPETRTTRKVFNY